MQTAKLRRLAATYWKPVLALAAGIPAALNGLKSAGVPIDRFVLSTPAGRETLIGLGVSALIIVRFPRIAIALTRWILGPPPTPTNVSRIFRGPRPYGPQERAVFPGRKAETEDCWEALQEHAFLILEGESGSGKSSFLNAALLPRLRETMWVFDCRINDDPFGKLRSALMLEPYRPDNTGSEIEALVTAFSAARDRCARSSDLNTPRHILVCIDQFEELFVTVHTEIRIAFLDALKRAVEDGGFHLIVAIRSDFTDLLTRLAREVDPKQRVLDLGSYYTLRAFTPDQAAAVLDQMLAPIADDDPVLKLQIGDFSQALVRELLQPSRDKRLYQGDAMSVLPIDLQTVGTVIESLGIKYFSPAGLRQLGGKAGLLRAYIEDAKTFVWRKTGVPGDQALLMLRQLVSPAGTKWSQTAESVGATLNCSPAEVAAVLDAFAEKYLVSRLATDSEGPRLGSAGRYELMHEHLVQILTESPVPLLQKAKDAEERLDYWLRRTRRAQEGRSLHRTPDLISALAAQPIPISENIQLWRFARGAAEREMLKHNLRGFFVRITPILLLTLIGISWAYKKEVKSGTQEWQIVGQVSAPNQFSLAQSPPEYYIAPDGSFRKVVVVRPGPSGELEFPYITVFAPGYAPVLIKLTRDSQATSFDYKARRITITPIALQKLPPYSASYLQPLQPVEVPPY
jgi:hypothetical protein